MIPRRRGDYYGAIECQEQLESLSKKLRIQRLKEVREQERLIASRACMAYRDCINSRKESKASIIKENKVCGLQREQASLTRQWQSTLTAVGSAHRNAREITEVRNKKTDTNKQLQHKRRADELQRSKSAIKTIQENIQRVKQSSDRLLELQQIRDQYQQSDREDAHAHGESFKARQRLLESHSYVPEEPHGNLSVRNQSRVLQSALSIERRFPIKVNATIIRHGLPHRDNTIIMNDAATEESIARRKTWAAVMTELLSRRKTIVRAREATNTVVRNKTVEFLETELKLLELADKQGSRQSRLCNVLGVAPDEEESTVQRSFEKVFLSRPIQTLYRFHSAYNHPSQQQQPKLSSSSAAPIKGEFGSSFSPRPHLPLYSSKKGHQVKGHPDMDASIRQPLQDNERDRREYSFFGQESSSYPVPSNYFYRSKPSSTSSSSSSSAVPYGDETESFAAERYRISDDLDRPELAPPPPPHWHHQFNTSESSQAPPPIHLPTNPVLMNVSFLNALCCYIFLYEPDRDVT